MLLAPIAIAAAVALPGPTPVSAYHGTLAYSRLDKAKGTWSLVIRTKGNDAVAPIAPRKVPFDVDLGPDGAGRTVAVYSRCASEPNRFDGADAIVYPGGTARGCSIYLYDPALQRERPIAGASGYMPAIWHTNLAYARGDSVAAVYLRVNGRTQRLDDGGKQFCLTHFTGCRNGRTVDISGLDLEGTGVAVAREVGGIYDAPATQMVLARLGKRATVVEARGNGISFRAMRYPTIQRGHLYYAETCAGDTASCFKHFQRYTIGTRKLHWAPSPSLFLAGFAQDGADAVYVRVPDEGWAEDYKDSCPCVLDRTRPHYR